MSSPTVTVSSLVQEPPTPDPPIGTKPRRGTVALAVLVAGVLLLAGSLVVLYLAMDTKDESIRAVTAAEAAEDEARRSHDAALAEYNAAIAERDVAAPKLV